MLEPHPLDTLVIRPLRRAEFEQLVAMGAFDDENVELLDGRLVEMNPQRSIHAWVVDELDLRLKEGVARRARVRVQLPLALDDVSEPEPDLAIVPLGDYQDQHPSTALLVVEVAETSLLKDRTIKGPLYARANIQEYWLVNIEDRMVEVHDQPRNGRYSRIVPVPFSQALAPRAFPEVSIRIADFVR